MPPRTAGRAGGRPLGEEPAHTVRNRAPWAFLGWLVQTTSRLSEADGPDGLKR